MKESENESIMEAADLKEIKSWLGKGGIQKLAKEFGITNRHAYLVLRGQVRNFEFLEAAISRATDQKARISNGMKNMSQIQLLHVNKNKPMESKSVA
jgi:hypothetical protein